MQTREALRAWGKILCGYKPVLSVEITNACPLSCPGCYAYQPEHVQGTPLLQLGDYQGQQLVGGVLQLVERYNPLAIYIVGGEPLVRFRELNQLLPELCQDSRAVRIVTSAVRPIPRQWAGLPQLDIIISVDGLQPEHDVRRKPATYRRILKHIQGHQVVVHCTITSQMLQRATYLEEFMCFWSDRPEVESIQVSMFSPQVGETSVEILSAEMRQRAVVELDRLYRIFPKIRLNEDIVKAFLSPPENPQQCMFSRITHNVSADLKTQVTPCQLGGRPDCSQCGCGASIGLHAVAGRQFGPLKLRTLFEASQAIGSTVGWIRKRTGTRDWNDNGQLVRLQ